MAVQDEIKRPLQFVEYNTFFQQPTEQMTIPISSFPLHFSILASSYFCQGSRIRLNVIVQILILLQMNYTFFTV